MVEKVKKVYSYKKHAHVLHLVKESDELHHSIGSLVDGTNHGPKTDRDYLGRYYP